MTSYFLWPKYKLSSFFKGFYFFKNKSDLEKKLQELYTHGYPVVCSSGRSAINLIIKLNKFNRNDLVGVFPYANSCVINAVSNISTPTQNNNIKDTIKLVFNQWGFKKKYNKINEKVIEDSVDSLVAPKTNIFQNNPEYIFWSFPKILATSSGCVIWCKNKNDCISLKKIRDTNKASFTLWIMRIFSNYSHFFYNLWNGFELDNPNITIFQSTEIYKSLNNLDNIINDRKMKIEILKNYLIKEIKMDDFYYPTVIPVKLKIKNQDIINSGIISGFRNYVLDDNNNNNTIVVVPIPIHQDVPIEWIIQFKNRYLKK